MHIRLPSDTDTVPSELLKHSPERLSGELKVSEDVFLLRQLMRHLYVSSLKDITASLSADICGEGTELCEEHPERTGTVHTAMRMTAGIFFKASPYF